MLSPAEQMLCTTAEKSCALPVTVGSVLRPLLVAVVRDGARPAPAVALHDIVLQFYRLRAITLPAAVAANAVEQGMIRYVFI